MQNTSSVADAVQTALKNRCQSLEHMIRQLAQAVGNRAPEHEEIAAFFHSFMDGGWDAFEEASAHDTGELKDMDKEILNIQRQLSRLLEEEHPDLIGKYEDLLNIRMTRELDQAFLVGYQTAIRLLLMGILPVSVFTQEVCNNDTTKREA